MLSVGLVLPASRSTALEFIGAGYILTSGTAREIYAVGATYRQSSELEIFGSLLAEGGRANERVCDFGAIAGVRIFY
jgi:hypothetical protein